MKTILCIVMFVLGASFVRAQTNLTELLQQGMFEEQANHNLNAAIADYQALSTQFDKDRQLAATAIFRLGECYREENLTNEAAIEYRRILNEFPDQKTLATLSREDLAGMGVAPSVPGDVSGNSAAQRIAGNATEEADLLAGQISGIESLKSNPEEEARAVLALFPADSGHLEEMLLQMPQLREQVARLKANPKSTQFVAANGPVFENSPDSTNYANASDYVQAQLRDQLAAIGARIEFILDLQKARLKALQAAAGTQIATETAQVTTPTDEENQEIARLQKMIQNSPDLINAPGKDTLSPLVVAATRGQVKVAAFLLNHGADVNVGGVGGPPLVAAAKAAQRTMAEFLLEHGADVNAVGGEALDAAIIRGYEAVAETLLKARANPNVRNDNGLTPLNLAARDGSAKFIQMLLDAGADPNTPDNRGSTPLSNATLLGGLHVLTNVKLLLAAKADPNAGTCDLPLLCAINNRDIKAAELLLQAGANPNLAGLIDNNLGNLWRGGNPRITPLWFAVSMNQLPMVQLLLKHKADPNSAQIDNSPVIFNAVDKTNVLQALLDAGANPNVTDDQGRTPLTYAAEYDSPEAVRLLLGAKADPNAGTMDKPLLCAVDKRDVTSAELLLQAGADPNVDGLTRCQQGSYGSRWYPEYSATLRWTTPLWLAIQNHQLSMVQLLLKYKANPDAQTSEPPSAIFWAFRDTNILQALLDGGANPNVRNGSGQTPLRIAETTESGNVFIGNNNPPPDVQRAMAASIADLLRLHGALENLPDWDHITVSRPSTKSSVAYFDKGTNDWNQFTLMELLFRVYANPNNNFSFPDFAQIIVVRPNATGEKSKRIRINLLNSTNGVDCSRDVPLKFGDVVEIPEREHTLAENDSQIERFVTEILSCLRKKAGTAKLIVDGGQAIQVPLRNFEPVACYIRDVLANPISRDVLLSDSDMSRVKVTRQNPATGKLFEWTIDCSTFMSPFNSTPNFWVRDGDVIEVPEMR
ncbi:MAG TPA: ankyrin repeat domain-containing protein [Verrucomicrobiae bacterium]|nr:ankyrin repeat domain-containing protein [Verrucomicrobiae bacterium]